MRYTKLGDTDLEVSAIAFGGMSLSPEKAEAGKRAVARAFELGVTLYDTADVYWNGQAEVLLGQALKEAGIRRDQVVIATKCGIVFPGMEPSYAHKAYDLSPAYIKKSCEASLQRLGTDYVDLYQPHRIDYLTHPEETARALEDLKAEGKVCHAGVSNYTVAELCALSQYVRLETLQTRFSLLFLEPLESGLASVCLEKKMSVLCWAPLHRAALAGTKDFDHGDWQEQREAGVVTQLKPFAEEYGVTLGQLSLAWLMSLPGGVIPLVGTATAAHVEEAAGACEVRLERDDWYELLVIARGRPMPWDQRPYVYLKER